LDKVGCNTRSIFQAPWTWRAGRTCDGRIQPHSPLSSRCSSVLFVDPCTSKVSNPTLWVTFAHFHLTEYARTVGCPPAIRRFPSSVEALASLERCLQFSHRVDDLVAGDLQLVEADSKTNKPSKSCAHRGLCVPKRCIYLGCNGDCSAQMQGFRDRVNSGEIELVIIRIIREPHLVVGNVHADHASDSGRSFRSSIGHAFRPRRTRPCCLRGAARSAPQLARKPRRTQDDIIAMSSFAPASGVYKRARSAGARVPRSKL
jgi:hypothetical protein